MKFYVDEPNEKLFLNTLKFEFPTEPVTFYFSDTDKDGAHFTYLKSSILFPVGIESIFPELKNNDTLYTSFTREVEGAQSLAIDFNLPANFYLVKKYLNSQIEWYFKSRGLIVEPNRITHDNQIWLLNNNDNDIQGTDKYDRYTLKVDFDHFNNNPQLVLSFDRPTWVLHKSAAQILGMVDDPLADKQPSTRLFGVILYKTEHNNYTKCTVDKYCNIANKSHFDSANAFPVLNRELIAFLNIPVETEDETEDMRPVKPKNRYKKYYNKINLFYHSHLNNDDFRAIADISKDDFSYVNPLQIGHTNPSSKLLVFGKGAKNFNPQMGVNSGPFLASPYANIEMIAIFPKDDKDAARNLLKYFKNDYKQFFKGLKQYLGKDFSFSKHYLEIQDTSNIIGELDEFLENTEFDSDFQRVALYLTPIGKYSANREARKIYYQVKERLLKYNIVSQCIETSKMLAVLQDDETHKDKNGYPRKNFAYTLQNMSIAINAKLGGTPWRLSSPKQNELVVGVGAFKNVETNTQYIGSAFSVDNTGSFNSFEYFQKDELRELAGAIQEAVIQFTQINNKPERLIIHYYKPMNKKEFFVIEDALHKLNVDIPIYVVSIGKTESEDFVLFDGGDENLMPYSGRYVNLGDNNYLLCNNTRYENATMGYFDSFPFPIKIKIECPNDSENQIDTNTISQLIDQVYQFSRIYWKSVKQQNLPVTIKYPEMIAKMLPFFQNPNTNIDTNHLWFL